MNVFHVLIKAQYAAVLIIYFTKFSYHYNSDVITTETASQSGISYCEAVQIYAVYCCREKYQRHTVNITASLNKEVVSVLENLVSGKL